MKFRDYGLRVLMMWLCLGTAGALAQSDSVLVKRPTELREQPGEAARSLAPLAAQTIVTRMPARQGAWIQVRTAQGSTGWVHMFDLGGAAVPAPANNSATGALRGLTSLFSRGSSPAPSAVATSTIGIRGLNAEDISNARPNPAAVTQAEALRVDADQARRFASEASLSARAVEPLPVPSVAAPAPDFNQSR